MKKIASILLVAVLLLSACGTAAPAPQSQNPADSSTSQGAAVPESATGQTGSVEEPINLFLMHDKVGSPDYQPYFLEAGAELKEKIGVEITPVGYPSTDVFTAAVRAALPTQKAPNLFTWWATFWSKELADNGLLSPTTAIWDKYKDEYSADMRTAYTFGDEVYGVPWGVDYWLIYYNKDVYAQLGVTEPPKTWDEFIAVCDKAKGAGIAALNQTIVGEWPAFIWFEEICSSVSPTLYNELCYGTKKYTDPEAIEVFKLWQDMINKGYFTDSSADYFSDIPRMFGEDKLAMICGGTWYVKPNLLEKGVSEDKIGYFFLPTMDGKNRAIMELSPILISKNGENVEGALQAADYWMSAEGSTFLCSKVGSFPANTKADTSYLPQMKQDMQKTVVDGNFTLVNRYWENTPTELMLKINQKFAEFIVKPDTLEKITADIQALADEYWAANK